MSNSIQSAAERLRQKVLGEFDWPYIECNASRGEPTLEDDVRTVINSIPPPDFQCFALLRSIHESDAAQSLRVIADFLEERGEDASCQHLRGIADSLERPTIDVGKRTEVKLVDGDFEATAMPRKIMFSQHPYDVRGVVSVVRTYATVELEVRAATATVDDPVQHSELWQHIPLDHKSP